MMTSVTHVINFRDRKTKKLYNDKMEIQILELTKIPEDYQDPDGIVAWMKFFRGAGQKGDGRVGKRESIFGRSM